MIVYLVVPPSSLFSDDQTSIVRLSIEESSAGEADECLLVQHEFITHRAYGNQIDAICFVACVRLRLIYKQPFRTRST